MANPPGNRVDIVVCQKHGLRYNRVTDTGCAMCRREAGEAPRPAMTPPPSPRAAATPASPRPTVPATPPRATPAIPPLAAAPTPPRPSTPTPPPPSPPPADEVLPPLLPDLPPEPEALTATGSRPLDIVTCEKHGLRYNRAAESGCVRCRRESGVATTASTGAGRLGTAVRLDAPSSVRTQLIIAALLIGGTGGLCYAAHSALIKSYAGGFMQTGSAGMDAGDDPGEAYVRDNPADPAPWPPPRPKGPQPTAPPGMKGRGPVEQQKQIEELFRQMKEDEAKERGEEPPPAEEIPQ